MPFNKENKLACLFVFLFLATITQIFVFVFYMHLPLKSPDIKIFLFFSLFKSIKNWPSSAKFDWMLYLRVHQMAGFMPFLKVVVPKLTLKHNWSSNSLTTISLSSTLTITLQGLPTANRYVTDYYINSSDNDAVLTKKISPYFFIHFYFRPSTQPLRQLLSHYFPLCGWLLGRVTSTCFLVILQTLLKLTLLLNERR